MAMLNLAVSSGGTANGWVKGGFDFIEFIQRRQ